MINTNNTDSKPLKLYDIQTDDLVNKSLPEFIDFFEEHPDNMLDKPTIVGYSVDENKPEVFADDYELTSDIIARKKFGANNKINGTENYAIAFLKRYARWLKSERTRQSKLINTVEKTTKLVSNRINKGAVNTLLFPVSTYTKWLIDHLDVISGDDFEKMTSLNHNDKDYYLDLVLVKLKDCTQIRSSTVNSIVNELDSDNDNGHKSLLTSIEIAKMLYQIVNHNSNTILVYDNEPITAYGYLAIVLVNLCNKKKLTFPLATLVADYWFFYNDKVITTLKLYNEQDILDIIAGFTSANTSTTPVRITKKVLKDDNIRIDLNHNESLIEAKIRQLQPFASIPTFSNTIAALQLILDQCK